MKFLDKVLLQRAEEQVGTLDHKRKKCPICNKHWLYKEHSICSHCVQQKRSDASKELMRMKASAAFKKALDEES